MALFGIPAVHSQADPQAWLVAISESNVFAGLLGLLQPHPFSFGNQLQEGKIMWKIRGKLYCWDLTSQSWIYSIPPSSQRGGRHQNCNFKILKYSLIQEIKELYSFMRFILL